VAAVKNNNYRNAINTEMVPVVLKT